MATLKFATVQAARSFQGKVLNVHDHFTKARIPLAIVHEDVGASLGTSNRLIEGRTHYITNRWNPFRRVVVTHHYWNGSAEIEIRGYSRFSQALRVAEIFQVATGIAPSIRVNSGF